MNPIDKRCLCRLIAAAAVALPATGLADDLIVDGNGGAGKFKTIQAAVNAASNGDRILVVPGTYPGFQLTKSVSVYGLGTSPNAVVVGGIAFHPIYPHVGYEVRLSRMTINSTGSGAISGNELGSGVLELESLIVDGGIHLGVLDPDGFFLSISNCQVDAASPLDGFEGSTVSVTGAGVRVDVTRSVIRGADGTLSPFLFPLAALAIDDGAILRISQSILTGGDGNPIQDGAPALIVREGRVEGISGGASLEGGSAGPGKVGGPAILSGSPIAVGDAVLRGGDGSPDGLPLSGGGAVQQLDLPSVRLRLSVDGEGLGPATAGPGSTLGWELMENGGDIVALASSLRVTATGVLPGIQLDPSANLIVGHENHAEIPPLPPGIRLFITTQALVLDAGTGVIHSSAPTTVRVDS